MKKLLLILLSVVLLLTSACGAQESSSSEFENPLPNSSLSTPESSSEPASSSEPEIPEETEEMKTRKEEMQASIEELAASNEDVLGWIRVPNTNIDYPIMRHKADVVGSYYYMSRKADGSYHRDGEIYTGTAFTGAVLGSSSKDLSRNIVMHGHNWTNTAYPYENFGEEDTMFAHLVGYDDIEFAKENPYIYFSTAEEDMTWVVFAAFYTDIYFEDYIEPNLDDSRFTAMVKEARNRSEHDFDVDVNITDTIITLNTCTRRYPIGNKQRFVVMARLLREDEYEQTMEIEVTPNEDVQLPKGVTSR